MACWTRLHRAWRAAQQAAPDRAELEDPYHLRYLKAFLLLRILIGAIGLALPLVVWLGTALLPGGTWSLRGSLSAYYYSGMREFFTGALWATGVFLIAYKVFEPTVENLLTIVSGVAATFVAFFPTSIPAGDTVGQTALQEGIGETTVGTIHYTSAAIFILSLAVLSHLFATRESNRDHAVARGRHGGTFWKRLHNGCAITILVACAFVAVKHLPGLSYGAWVDQHNLWLGEVTAVVAFGVSWLCKGAELRQLVNRGDSYPGRAQGFAAGGRSRHGPSSAPSQS